jgi:hypothetical protein
MLHWHVTGLANHCCHFQLALCNSGSFFGFINIRGSCHHTLPMPCQMVPHLLPTLTLGAPHLYPATAQCQQIWYHYSDSRSGTQNTYNYFYQAMAKKMAHVSLCMSPLVLSQSITEYHASFCCTALMCTCIIGGVQGRAPTVHTFNDTQTRSPHHVWLLTAAALSTYTYVRAFYLIRLGTCVVSTFLE